jgi:hypothetical protein
MQSHVYRFPARVGQPVRWFLCSDLHLGHIACDVARIRREFDRAVALGANILINGDVFDAVTTGDKRFTPGQTVPEIASARDALAATVEYGRKVLAPYASHIRVIGVGNHETAWLKYRQSDPVAFLIGALNAGSAGQPIRHGGISGFIVSLLDIPSGEGKPLTLSHRLHYHHGVGGDSPVTKGTIDINRKHVAFEYDAVTFGHKHNRLFMDDVVCAVRPNGRIVHRERKAIQTGSYFRNVHMNTQADALGFTYAEESWHAAKPFGGWFLSLTPERPGKQYSVRQDVFTVFADTAVA